MSGIFSHLILPEMKSLFSLAYLDSSVDTLKSISQSICSCHDAWATPKFTVQEYVFKLV